MCRRAHTIIGILFSTRGRYCASTTRAASAASIGRKGDPQAHPLLAKLAPEPLSDEFDGEYLYRATRKRAGAVKQLIMNSQVVVGVGNIYASEALFRARIAPRRAARRLSRAQAQALTQAIKDVLAEAIRHRRHHARGTTSTPTEHRGISGSSYSCMNGPKQPCRVCKSPVKQFVQGQRSTYWCATCQR